MRRLLILLLGSLLVIVLPGCRQLVGTTPLRPAEFGSDTSHWPNLADFSSISEYSSTWDIAATVHLRVFDEDEPIRAGEERPEDALRIIYDLVFTNASGEPLKQVTIHARLDESIEPFIHTHYLGLSTLSPEDLVPGDMPRGIALGRSSVLPDPTRRVDVDEEELLDAIMAPIWMEITWNGESHYMYIPPEDIQYDLDVEFAD